MLHYWILFAFVLSMFVMAIFAVYLAVAMPGQLVNVFIGTFAFYLVATAWMTVRRTEGVTSPADKIVLLVSLCLCAPFAILSLQLANGIIRRFACRSGTMQPSGARGVRVANSGEQFMSGEQITRSLMVLSCVLAGAPFGALAQSVPAAIYTDPPADHAHPAAMTVLHIPSHGVLINGLVYSPSGAGPHPTLVICHGLPGNEKNLDLAQAVRRAGWNAVTFNYRGSWGSPGVFRFGQVTDDAAAVLAYLRDSKNAAALGVDTKRLAIAGHSMGGWVTARTAARDHGLIGAVMISAGDLGRLEEWGRDKEVAFMADDMESLVGVTPESMADEIHSHAQEFLLKNAAAGLVKTPLLALTSDDGLANHTDALIDAIKAAGGQLATTQHVATDHGWSDHRIALESTIITWLAGLH
jgi:pimeloyl-ACP methyl ester carboxylesterase